MENSRQSSMAQLSAWTDAMKFKSKEKSKAQPEIAENYDQEFEDYDEDFEVYETPVKAPPKPTPAAPTFDNSAKTVNSSIVRNLAPQQEAKAEKTYSSFGATIARSIADPRAARIERVRKSGVLDLQIEKFTNLNIPPSTPYEHYLQQLRTTTDFRQMGTPGDQDTREIEVNTDEVLCADKEVQIGHGDDTTFYRLVDVLRKSKLQDANNSGDNVTLRQVLQEDRLASVKGDSHHNGQFGRLSSFLQQSTSVMETLLREHGNIQNDGVVQSKKELFFAAGSDWALCGQSRRDGSNEPIRSRNISFVAFSKANPNMLLTIHPFSMDDEADLRPYKSLLAVWDVSEPGSPSYLLETSGDLCVGAFANLHPYVVVGGATDGTLHLWDLREPSSLHMDRDCIDLRISQGIRSPTFSTNLTLSTVIDGEEDILHHAAIRQIESIDFEESLFPVSTTSQFVSLDESGTVIFWMTHERQGSLPDELRKSPWGKMSLLPTRQISTTSLFPNSNIAQNGPDNAKNKKSSLFSPCAALGILPNEVSTVLVGLTSGNLHQLGVSGTKSGSTIYRRLSNKMVAESKSASQHRQSMKSYDSIATIAVRRRVSLMDNQRNTDNITFFILVGRQDGSVDLFLTPGEFPVLSWSMDAFENSKRSLISPPVKHLKWLGDYQFVAIDDLGRCFHFDLCWDMEKPLSVTRLDVKGGELDPLQSFVDISCPTNPMGSDARAAVATHSCLHVRSLNPMVKSEQKNGDIKSFDEKLLTTSTNSKSALEIV